MRQQVAFFTLVRKHITKIKYIGLVLGFFSVIITIRTYINYLAIQETIYNTQHEIQQQKEQTAYTENFLLRYYNSEYRNYFFHHKNWILNPWETIIQIEIITPTAKHQEPEISNENTNTSWTISPAQSRNQFIREKWEKI